MTKAVLFALTLAVAVMFLVDPGTPSDARSLRFVGYIPLSRSGMLNILDYLTIDGDHLFVAGISSGVVVRVPMSSSSLAPQVSTLAGPPAAHGVAVDPATRLGFVSRSDANKVQVFDVKTMVSMKDIDVEPDPDAILYIPPSGSAPAAIYVAHGDSKTGTLIDPSKQIVTGKVPLGGRAEFAVFDRKSGLVYQNLEDTGELAAIDTRQSKVVGRWPVEGCEGPSGLAIDELGRRLIVACGGNARAAIFDLAAHRTLATYPVASHPDTIAYDAEFRRIYSAGGFGQLSVLQGDEAGRFTPIETLRTHIGAHTLAFDPATRRLYVAYAGLIVGPRLAVFDARL